MAAAAPSLKHQLLASYRGSGVSQRLASPNAQVYCRLILISHRYPRTSFYTAATGIRTQSAVRTHPPTDLIARFSYDYRQPIRVGPHVYRFVIGANGPGWSRTTVPRSASLGRVTRFSGLSSRSDVGATSHCVRGTGCLRYTFPLSASAYARECRPSTSSAMPPGAAPCPTSSSWLETGPRTRRVRLLTQRGRTALR